MILDYWHKAAFEGYEKPLQKLEKAFNKAGLPVVFHLFADPFGNKMVRVTGGKANLLLFCIEWDSPAQAAKAVKEGVKDAEKGVPL